MAEQQQGGRNPKRPRVEADKRRDALLHVQDEYADIDFTKYQKLVGAGAACVATVVSTRLSACVVDSA